MAAAGPIYLYTGPEFGKRNEAVDAVKAAHKKKFGVIDEHSFYLLETPFNEVMTILRNYMKIHKFKYPPKYSPTRWNYYGNMLKYITDYFLNLHLIYFDFFK